MKRPARQQVVLTVDVEDWAQSTWDHSLPIGERCAEQTLRVLELLERFPDSRATFFVLGRFAERHPWVVARIAQTGHEVASHGYEHLEVFTMEPEQFERDLQTSTDAIASACGKRPVGYRAADFSIVGESLWALGILAASGYRYDSSIVPLARSRYGIPSWPQGSALARFGQASIVEVPIGTIGAFGKRWPLGGGYARLLPRRLLLSAVASAGRANGAPVFYCHPYELDAADIALSGTCLPLGVRLHQGVGRRGTEAKLGEMLDRFECISVEQAIADAVLPTMDPSHFAVRRQTARPPAFRRSPVGSQRATTTRR